MKHVGIREFRDHATRYFAGHEPLAVERHGQVIGFYVPAQLDKDQAQRALAGLDAALDEIMERTGMSEAELVQALSDEA